MTREKAKEETRNRIRKNKNRRPSKFNTKYKDRIEAIQFTEMKKDENMKLYKEMEKREENNKH